MIRITVVIRITQKNHGATWSEEGGATVIYACVVSYLFEIVPQEVLWSIWGSHQTI